MKMVLKTSNKVTNEMRVVRSITNELALQKLGLEPKDEVSTLQHNITRVGKLQQKPKQNNKNRNTKENTKEQQKVPKHSNIGGG